MLLLFILFWADITPSQAGPTRSRFDRAYPTISRVIQTEEPRDGTLQIECTADAVLLERWSVSIPPWHEAARTLRLPTTVDRPGSVARIPDSVRLPFQTRASEDGDDEDGEPTLTDYDYQEWLSATVAPNLIKGG
ncbi:MAG: hypothetical protein CMJ33_03550 [Phycisphaerae bacterium]|nr:hypothetical protein [Phycisphaerae bacterium]